uniref:Glutamate receptor n=1 Tax=Setaria italica TaxID=4555 RepID=K3YZ13_SETIT
MATGVRIAMFLFLAFSSAVAQNVTESKVQEFHVGVVLDLGTTVGKVAHTSISIAVEDFYAIHPNYTTRLVLHVRDSMSDDVQAASAVLDLLENYNVQAIIGPQKSSQAVFVSALGNKHQLPIISFTATSTSLSSPGLPYFVQATSRDSAQVSSIASIIKTYGWREVVPIYVNNNYGRGIIPDLANVLEGIDAHIPYRSAIDESATGEQITQELYKLMTMHTRVFVVHMSSSLGSLLFTKAKEIGMMSKGFVWIITDGLASLVDSLNHSVVEAMNGALGVVSYVPKSTELDNFTMRWYMRSRNDHPNDPTLKLSIFGLWSYDTIWAVAQAAEKAKVTEDKFERPPAIENYTSSKTLENSRNGPAVLKEILQTKFQGLSGYFDLTDGQLQISMFQIINVVGKAHRVIGFWTAQNGISQQSDQRRSNTTYWSTTPTRNLKTVIWPGESTEVPRGWEIPTDGKKLQVGIVIGAGYPKYIDANEDSLTGEIKASGLAIEIFEEAVKRLPYALPYEYVVFNTTENKYDIAVGDITIRYNRSLYVDFTLPYTESGVAMVVPVKESVDKNAWIFLKPLTPGMWFGTIILFIYTGIVIWLLELLGNNKNVQEEMVKRLTSRIVLVIWLFFLVVLKSSYTASLTSMLTVQQLQPTVTNVDELLKTGQSVGYARGSYIKGLLEELGFDASKIKPYDTPEGYHNVLSKGSKNGGIAALVDEIPYIKLFLAEHCMGYTMVGPIYKTAGFGYALRKGSPLVGDISQAILNITGGDTIIQIEKKWIGDQNNCQNVGTISGTGSLTFDNFAGPIIATGVASTTSLVVALIVYFCKKKQVGPQNGGSEQILPPENGGDEESQCQQAARDRGMHGQVNKVMRNGSPVICRGEGIHRSWVSSSARF